MLILFRRSKGTTKVRDLNVKKTEDAVRRPAGPRNFSSETDPTSSEAKVVSELPTDRKGDMACVCYSCCRRTTSDFYEEKIFPDSDSLSNRLGPKIYYSA